jgi:hypothetical protein
MRGIIVPLIITFGITATQNAFVRSFRIGEAFAPLFRNSELFTVGIFASLSEGHRTKLENAQFWREM